MRPKAEIHRVGFNTIKQSFACDKVPTSWAMKSQTHGFSRNTVIHAIRWQLNNFELEVEMCLRKRVKFRTYDDIQFRHF